MKVPSISELRKYCTRSDDELIGLRIFRYFSVFPLKLLLYTPITPNILSVLWLLTGLVAVFLFSKGTYSYTLIGALLYQFALFVDQLDGPVARFKKMTNLGGDYLDKFTSYLHRTLMFLAIGIGSYNYTKELIYLYAGIIASLFSILAIFMKLTEYQVLLTNNKIDELKKESQKIFKRKYFVKEYILEFFRPSTPIINVILVAAIFNLTHYLIVVYGVLSVLLYINISLSGYKRTRRLN